MTKLPRFVAKLINAIPEAVYNTFDSIEVLTEDNPSIGGLISLSLKIDVEIYGKTFTDLHLQGRIVGDTLYITHIEYNDGDTLEEALYYSCEELDDATP